MARWNPGRLAVEVIATLFVVAGVLGLGSSSALTAPDDAVHLTLGLAGLAAARGPRAGRAFLIAGGVVFFLWHYGGAVLSTEGAAPVSLATAEDWLNIWLAVSMIALACLLGDRHGHARAAVHRRGAELSVSWRQVRVPSAYPTTRPRHPRPPAGSRPPGRGAYAL